MSWDGVSMGDPRFSRADSKSGQLQRLVYQHLVREHAAKDLLPTSIRFLMYELEQLGLISKERRAVKPGKKMARGPVQDLSDAVTWIRDADIIPWSWIVDDTRDVTQWESAPSVADYLKNQVDFARIDLWVGVPTPLVLCESRTVGGVLERTISPEYLVPVAPTGGQTRGFLINKVAPILASREHTVLYLGDLDDAGGDIEDNTRLVLEDAIGKPLVWRRIAITQEQADELRARGVRPIQKTDARYRDGNPHEAFECEALGQGYLPELVRNTLDMLLPEPLELVREREEAERERWAKVLEDET